jgi:hypothetical protein
MLLNKYIVIYYLFLFSSLAVSLLSAGVGLKTIIKWRTDQTAETRRQLENRLYLCRSAMFVGASVRVIMVPLWFFMLQSLITMVPGAMCLAGVHMAVPTYSWLASAMKLVLPLFYFTWISIEILDRKIMEQPFLKFRHLFLIIIIIAVLAETFLDIKYLSALEPIKVTCCTALFDMGGEDIPLLLTESHWYFVIAFCTVLIGQTVFLLLPRKNKTAFLLIIIFAIILFITLPLGLHTQLSPLLLDAPFHHCIFCLLQNKVFILAGGVLSLAAIYFSFAYGLIGFIGGNKDGQEQIREFLKKVRLISLFLFTAGFILLLVPVLLYFYQNQGGL